MLTAIWNKPIEIISGLMMCAVGIYASLSFQDPNIVAIGGALTTLGGVLVSWSASTVNQHAKAAELLRPQLESATRHLSTVSGQLGSAASALRSDSVDSETAYYMVAHANQTLLGSISDIQKIVGTELDLAPMWENATRVANLAERMIVERRESSSDEEEEDELNTQMRKELSLLKDQIKAFAPQAPIATFEDVSVPCPNPLCNNTSVRAVIGMEAGATAVAQCANCQERFNVHRRRDGIFTRRHDSILPNAGSELAEYQKILRSNGIRLVPAAVRQILSMEIAKAFGSRTRRAD